MNRAQRQEVGRARSLFPPERFEVTGDTPENHHPPERQLRAGRSTTGCAQTADRKGHRCIAARLYRCRYDQRHEGVGGAHFLARGCALRILQDHAEKERQWFGAPTVKNISRRGDSPQLVPSSRNAVGGSSDRTTNRLPPSPGASRASDYYGCRPSQLPVCTQLLRDDLSECLTTPFYFGGSL
jgi:hypothetical protein